MAVVVSAAPYLPIPPKNHLMGCCHHASSERQAEMGLATRREADTRAMGTASAGSRENELVCKGQGLGMSPRMEAAAEQEMPEKWLMPLLSSWRDVKRRYLGNDQWSNLLWMALHVKIIYSNPIWGWIFSPFPLFHESFKMDSNPNGKEN